MCLVTPNSFSKPASLSPFPEPVVRLMIVNLAVGAFPATRTRPMPGLPAPEMQSPSPKVPKPAPEMPNPVPVAVWSRKGPSS